MTILCFVLTWIIVLNTIVYASISSEEYNVLAKILKYYQPDVMPKGNEKSESGESSSLLRLNISITLHNYIIEQNRLFLQVTLQSAWYDSRLYLAESRHARSKFYLPDSLKVWTPDLGFSGLTSTKTSRIFDTVGYLRQITKYSGYIQCISDAFQYPFGSRKCRLQMVVKEDGTKCYSYALFNFIFSEVDIACRDPCFQMETDPIYCTLNATDGNNLYIDFELKSRKSWTFIFRAMIPSALMVLVGVAAGFSKRRTVRAIMSGSALLCLVLLWTLQDKVIFLSMSDIWFMGCMVIQIVAIFEFLVFRQTCGERVASLPNPRSHESIVFMNSNNLLESNNHLDGSVSLDQSLKPTVRVTVKQKGHRISGHICFLLVLLTSFLAFTVLYFISVAGMLKM